MKAFPKRLYAGFGDFGRDIGFLLKNRPSIRLAMRGDIISESFRERLMLMVTQVNGCRYCSYFHAKEALKAGIAVDELEILLAGEIPNDTPEDEIPALLYAQHWAEADSRPDPQIQQKFMDTYGVEKTEAIEVILRMIRVGNLSGNLWDYILYRLTFGRRGLLEEEQVNE
jgi:AhpD family alkylhydroperoxidase